MAQSKEAYMRSLLNQGEKVIYQAQIHPTAYVFPLFMVVVGAVVSFAPDYIQAFFAERYAGIAQAALNGASETYLGFILMFMATAVLIQIYQARKNNLNVLTVMRVIAAKGTIVHNVKEVYLHKVTDVKAKQSMFERLLGRGRVFIKDFDSKKDEWIIIDYVGDPKRYKEEILAACARFGNIAKQAKKRFK